jgi:hypothetical protein
MALFKYSPRIELTSHRSKMKQIIGCAFFLWITVTGFAQFAERMDLTEGRLGISYTAVPIRPFKDTTGGFGYQALGLNIQIPLFGNQHPLTAPKTEIKHPHFYQIGAHAALDYLAANIGFLAAQHDFYNASLGMNGIFSNGKKNIFLLDATMGFACDQFIIQDNAQQYRFSGSFLVDHIHSASVMYFYGIALNYAYGKPLPLPVLGIRKKFSAKWSVTALLPVSLDFTDRITKDMSLGFLLRPAGNRYQFQNFHNFDSVSSSGVYLQLRQFELGVSYFYRFTRALSLGAEAGLLAGGDLKFTQINSPATTLSESSIKAGAKFRLTLRYHWPPPKSRPVLLDFENEILRLN